MTVQLAFPKKSVPGVVVLPMEPFGRNVMQKGNRTISCGKLYYMGKEETQPVTLDINSLAAHIFLTGSTGTGKSNIVYHMLDKLSEKGIHFMVVEPAKGEYKNVFGTRKDVLVLGTNYKKTELLRINPFAFSEDVHVLEHIDRLIELFNVCWSMYAAMPAVLKEAVEEAYISCGWDLEYSVNRYGNAVFPTFSDLQKALVDVIERSAYDEEVKSNYKGSLLTRVRSLTNGLNGQIFCSEEIPENVLFDKNVIVDLSRVGATETKSLIMGILVIRLQEYRMSNAKSNSELQHVTVLEEAHHLLKKTSSEQTMEGSNVLGKSVEMLTNAIAEMRTYGEGFLIADQSPGLMDISVIRNTNTKIVLRTPEYNDRLLVGKAANLNEGQIDEIAKFPLGVAAVYQNDWLEPVLCKFDKYEYDTEYEYKMPHIVNTEDEIRVKCELMYWLLQHRVANKRVPDFAVIEKNIDKLMVSSQTKIRIKQVIYEDAEKNNAWKQEKFDSLSELVVEILGCKKELFQLLKRSSSPEDLQKAMCDLQKNILCTTISDDLLLEINHCFMKVFSKQGKQELKQYYEWDYHIRHKVR